MRRNKNKKMKKYNKKWIKVMLLKKLKLQLNQQIKLLVQKKEKNLWI